MLFGNWATFGTFELGSLLPRRGARHLDPSVVSVPRCVVDIVPSLESRHPAVDSACRVITRTVGDKGREQGEASRHSVRFRYTLFVAILRESEEASGVRSPGTYSQSIPHGLGGFVPDALGEGGGR